MGAEAPSSALEIHEDMVFQRREWLAERIGWGIALGIVLAALLGLLGPGPISSATLGAAGDPLRVQYQRLARAGQPSRLRLMLAPGQSGEPRLEINKTYLEPLHIESIVPEPIEQVPGPSDFVQWRFSRVDEPHPFTVVIHLRHTAPGRQSAEVRFEGQTAQFWQWVYP